MAGISYWSDIDKDILESVLQKLPLIDRLSSRAVCSYWRSVATTHVASYSSSLKQKLEEPLLLIEEHNEEWSTQVQYWSPNIEDEEREGGDSVGGKWLYSLKEKKFIKLKFGGPRTRCVGSSHGWLIFTKEKLSVETLFIYNPVLDIVIRPLNLSTLSLDLKDDFIRGDRVRMNFLYFSPVDEQHIIKNAVLWGDPVIKSDNNYAVVIIYGTASKLAFAKCGDTNWGLLEGSSSRYCDVLSSENYVYAMTVTGTVQAWDFCCCDSPSIVLHIKPGINKTPRNSYVQQKLVSPKPFYLVESMGELLLVRRYNEFITSGTATRSYCLYKLDFYGSPSWVELDSLQDNRAIFLGGNQAVTISGYARGIYYPDETNQVGNWYNEIDGKMLKIHEPTFWVYS